VNVWLGRLHGNLLVGLGYGWWVSKHNRHHAHPNQVERDPDIGNGAIAFTADDRRNRRRFTGFLTRRQAWFFFPILLFEGLNLHVASARTSFGRTRTKGPRWTRAVEGGMLIAHFAGYLALVFWVLSPMQAVCFIVIQQGLFGVYMGCSFAPNHKGMPVFAKDDEIDFLSRQVLTSRNIRGGRATDWALGGLNYQIEHHLFPSMPRPNLRRAQTHVRTFCAQHDLGYHQTGLFASYAQVLRHLNTVGGPLRPELEY
jgi:fatty acid desaturase